MHCLLRLVRFFAFFFVLFFILPIVTLSSSCLADGLWKEWTQARTFYDQHQDKSALKEFLEHPSNDPAYYYNLGIVYFRLGKWGAALGHLEIANRIHPHERDIQYNLGLARRAVTQKYGTENLDPSSYWAEKIADRLSLDEVRTVLGLVGCIVALLWSRAYWLTRNVKQSLLHPSGALAFAGFLIFASLYFTQRIGTASSPAILIQSESIRSGPGEHYLELTKTLEGSKIRLLGPLIETPPSNPELPSEIWRQVRYAKDSIGWIRESALFIL